MGRKSLIKKIATFVIMFFFVISAILPTISGIKTNPKIINDGFQEILKDNEELDVTFYSFGFDKTQTTEIKMTQNQVDLLFEKLKQYTTLFNDNPQSSKAHQLKNEIIQIAQVEDLLPTYMKNELTSEKKPFPMVGFKNPKIKNPTETQTKISAFLCNFVSTGEGSLIPIIILPRLVPIFIIPIPRIFLGWVSNDSITSLSGMLSERKFIAYGQQIGMALGFCGIGFSIPNISYGLIGYALYASANAENNLEMTFDPFAEGWQYRKKITIDHNMVDGHLYDFPVLISTTDIDLRDKAQVDGDDILFMDGSGVASRLFHEIEEYDDGSGNLVAWVNIPLLYSTSDTEIYMYYGNPETYNQQAPELVWDENYILVNHMTGDNAYDLKDSTFYDNDIKDYGGFPNFNIDAFIAKGVNFNPIYRDYISASDSSSLDLTEQITLEAWIKIDNLYSDSDSIISKYWDGSKRAYDMGIRNGEIYIIMGDVAGGSVYSYGYIDFCTTDLNLGRYTWYHIVMSWNGYQGRGYVFKNGVASSNTFYKIYPYSCGQNSAPLCIGSHMPDHIDVFDGIIDEVRISNIARNSEWILTEYNNQNDPSSFYNIGPEET